MRTTVTHRPAYSRLSSNATFAGRGINAAVVYCFLFVNTKLVRIKMEGNDSLINRMLLGNGKTNQELSNDTYLICNKC
jgi:hypothetical protein